MRPRLLAANPPHLSVKEAYNDGAWRNDILQDYLAADLQRSIMKTLLSFIPQFDCIVWKPSSYEHFTTSPAYAVVRSRLPKHPTAVHLWSLSIPLKTFFLLWLLFNKLVPFPEVFTSLDFSLASKCPHYPPLDSIQHCLCDCALAFQLWHFVAAHFALPAFSALSL